MSFSVLMSVYYKEDPFFLDQALESLFNQTKQVSDVVIVHDGPLTTGLYEILDKWKIKLPINEVILDQNVGLGIALNKGLENCKFDLVARVDTDDINSANRFEIQYEHMINNLDVAICGSHVTEFDKDPSKISSERKVPIGKNINDFIFKRNPFNHMTVMYRKSAVIDCGSYQHLQFMEDYYLWIRMYLKGYKLNNLDMFLVNARVGNGMLERRKGIDYCKSELKIMKYLLKENIPNKLSVAGIFLTRSFIRLLPKSLLKSVYKIIRK